MARENGGPAVKRSRSRKDSDPDWHHSATSVSPADDLLQETFEEEEELQRKYRRDVEDDMEDILSMPLAKSLQSRRPSQSNLKTYLPTSSSSTSLASFSHPHPDDSTRHDPSSDDPIETLQTVSPPPSKLPRSTSPISITRTSSPRQPSPSLSSPASNPPKANVVRTRSKGSNTDLPFTRSPPPHPREAGWETLQVSASPPSAPTTRSTSPRLPSPSTTRFPTSRPLPDSRSTKPSPTPARASPRVRAQTQNWRPVPPRSASGSALAALSGASKPVVAKKTQSRQRSFSMNGREDEVGPNPPWMDEVPQVFRDERGELGKTGRLDDLVLPAVARRLEAERLAKLEEQGLISSWEKDGTPRGGVHNGVTKGGRENGRTPTSEGEEVEMDRIDGEGKGVVEQTVVGEEVSQPAKDASSVTMATNPPKVADVWPLAAQEPQRKDKVEDAHGGGCCNCTVM